MNSVVLVEHKGAAVAANGSASCEIVEVGMEPRLGILGFWLRASDGARAS